MLDALNQAICQRAPSEADKLIHPATAAANTCRSDTPSDWQRRYRHIRRAASGIPATNALAESIIGLFKTEVIKFWTLEVGWSGRMGNPEMGRLV